MGAYNLYKGQHLCHNQYTLNDILKGEWGFDGVVISDWGGTHDTRQAITNGLDMEFGSWTNGLSNGASNAYDNYYLANPYLNLIREGKVGTTELDDKVRRILRLIFRTVMNPDRPWGSMLSPEHYEAARRIGEEGIVLLQNKGNVLPIDLNRAKKILVVGENAIKMMTVGGGSSSLKVQREISPLDGLKTRLGKDGIEVDYARGYVGDVTGNYNGVTTGQNLEDKRSEAKLIAEAVEKAKTADAFVFGTPVHYASASGNMTSFMDRLAYAGGKYLAYKPAAVCCSARRAGTTSTLDQLVKYPQFFHMPLVNGSYWAMVHGSNPEQVLQDAEGCAVMQELGRNMAWLLRCIEAGQAAGIDHPENPRRPMTNFIR